MQGVDERRRVLSSRIEQMNEKKSDEKSKCETSCLNIFFNGLFWVRDLGGGDALLSSDLQSDLGRTHPSTSKATSALVGLPILKFILQHIQLVLPTHQLTSLEGIILLPGYSRATTLE